ncbi:MAG: hypothetical protein AAGA21_12575 [Pseudomonadota bacterium]
MTDLSAAGEMIPHYGSLEPLAATGPPPATGPLPATGPIRTPI